MGMRVIEMSQFLRAELNARKSDALKCAARANAAPFLPFRFFIIFKDRSCRISLQCCLMFVINAGGGFGDCIEDEP